MSNEISEFGRTASAKLSSLAPLNFGRSGLSPGLYTTNLVMIPAGKTSAGVNRPACNRYTTKGVFSMAKCVWPFCFRMS